MPRRSKPQEVIEQLPYEIVFKKVASGFFWQIRSDILNGIPSLHLNLTAIEVIETEKQEDEVTTYTVYLQSGKTYTFKSREQLLDLYNGLEALKKFIQGK